jgi:hypothetical protein
VRADLLSSAEREREREREKRLWQTHDQPELLSKCSYVNINKIDIIRRCTCNMLEIVIKE